MKAVARRMPGRARLQYLLAHAKARTENRSCQAGLLHLLAHMGSRARSRPGRGAWGSLLLERSSCWGT